LNAIKFLFNSKPLQINYYYFKEAQKYIDQKSENTDLIIAAVVRIAEYVYSKQKPKIFDMADSIGLTYKSSYKRTSSLFWKLIYFLEYPRMLRYEAKMIEHFDATILFNQRDIDYFNCKKIHWFPHGTNQSLLEYQKTATEYSNFVSFFGKMNYQPNIDAVVWFAKNILPELPSEINFQIIGANPTKEIIELQKENPRIFIRGYIDDPYLLLKSSLCVVAPMQTGGGIQNKILETMALGTIVITTPYSAYPIATSQDEVLLIADKPTEWINIITDIYKNPTKYEAYKTRSREYIRNKFTWDIYEQKYISLINELLDRHSSTNW
jgi:glycosyltransferase involved in cell wall biosynthesis